MEIILHLGAHRTGSTAVEQALSANADLLAGEGLAVWPPRRLRALPGFGQVPGLPEAGRQALRAGLAERFAGLARRGIARLVISEENMVGGMHGSLTAGALYPHARDRLLAYAAVLPAPVRWVGIGVRGHARHWLSCQAYVLPRRRLPRFEALAPALAALPRGWADLVGDAAAAFPEAEILVWTQESLAADLAAIACALAGRVGAEDLVLPEGPVNAGADGSDHDLIHELREADPGIAAGQLARRLRAARAERGPGPAPRFTPEAEARMARRYAADLARIAAMGGRVRLLSPLPEAAGERVA